MLHNGTTSSISFRFPPGQARHWAIIFTMEAGNSQPRQPPPEISSKVSMAHLFHNGKNIFFFRIAPITSVVLTMCFGAWRKQRAPPRTRFLSFGLQYASLWLVMSATAMPLALWGTHVINKTKKEDPAVVAYMDAEVERKFQEWKAKQSRPKKAYGRD